MEIGLREIRQLFLYFLISMFPYFLKSEICFAKYGNKARSNVSYFLISSNSLFLLN
jgi:hypothetical protein